jgi:hypothetical protein
MHSQLEYEYVNLLIKEARKLKISDSLLHHYAGYYLNVKEDSYINAYKNAIKDLKKERGIFNDLKQI